LLNIGIVEETGGFEALKGIAQDCNHHEYLGKKKIFLKKILLASGHQ